MKKLILLFLLLPAGLFSQNWQLINPGNVYFYKTNGSELINNTVKVDSMVQNTGDTVFYLNTVFIPCDTCEQGSIICFEVFGYEYYYHLNIPNFLQKEVHVMSNGKWFFKDTADFVILSDAGFNDSWLFDTANNIFAQITALTYTEVFDSVYDSVKTITLSNNQKIRISRNFGVIEFPDLYGSNDPSVLVGIAGDTIAGERMYKFSDYFNFNVGDVFQYFYEGHWVIPPYWLIRTTKYEIFSKEISGDTIKYGIEGIYREFSNDGVYFTDTLIFVDSTSHITNQYLNTLVDFYSTGIDEGLFLVNLLYSKESFTLIDTASLVNFSSDEYLYPNLYRICVAHPEFLGANSTEIVKKTYTPGLGLTIYEVDGVEWNWSNTLEGFVRNGDTIGTVSDDDVLLYRELLPATKKPFVRTYPNPAESSLKVSLEGSRNNQPVEITLMNLQGQRIYQKKAFQNQRLITINTSSFPNGFYLMEIKFPGHTETHKVVIRHP